MTQSQLAAIREAANAIVQWTSGKHRSTILAGYHAQAILRLLDEAEADGVTTLSFVENGNRFVRPNYICAKCGRVLEYREPYCPGCGRRIEGAGEGAHMSCYNCKNGEMFSQPREYDGFCVYGVCLKDMGKNGRNSAYPIYIPGGGACKDKIPTNRDSRQVKMDFTKEAADDDAQE